MRAGPVSALYSAPSSLSHVPDGHQATPVKGNCYEERSQHPANLKALASYPVIAVCQTCHGRIRLAEPLQMEWTHVPGDQEPEDAG
jgi:hypothetical protein